LLDISFSDCNEKNNRIIEKVKKIIKTINQLPCGPIDEKYLILKNLYKE